jgi:hypothetical protein
MEMLRQRWPVGFYPFWFWNDVLSADEVRWQVQEMADKGIRGFFVHPRQGLGLPYLSDSFMRMVDVAVEAAETHGLSVHLYDEYPYPSGIAGGEVILGSPEYYATSLVHKTYDLDAGAVRVSLPRGKVLSCIAYPLLDGKVDWQDGSDLRRHVGVLLTSNSYRETGLTPYNRKRYFASEPTPVLETMLSQRCRLFVSVQIQVDHFKYWGHYVDVLNADAMRRYMALTHERYRERYADRFGKTILSIFTDEICPHWSSQIPTVFKSEYGYDLCQAMPALQARDHPDHIRVADDFYRLVYRMFCETFERPVSTWCQENRLAYTGEKPSLRMSQLAYMDVPGCEPGHTKVGVKLDLLQSRLRGNAKATASAAYFYDKAGSLCECYHSTGWSATLQDAKFVADGLLLMGIDYLVPHGFFYSTHALKKHDAPPTFFFQVPFWLLFGHLTARTDRIAQLFANTHIDADVLVVEPSSGLPTRVDSHVYETLLWTLMSQHIDFHIVDTDILEAGQIESASVRVRDVVARAVIVPPMQVLEAPLCAWLDEYEAAGGRVVRCDHSFSPEAVTRTILGVVQPSLHVRENGQEAEDVLSVHRASKDKHLWFLLNTSAKEITVELDAHGNLCEMPLDLAVPSLRCVDGRYLRTIAPFESFVLQMAESVPADQVLPSISVLVGGEAEVHPDRDNLLRMYNWHMSLLGEQGEPGPSAVVPAVPLANQLEQGRFSFVPAYAKHFGHVPELSMPEMCIQYEYAFDCAYDGAIQLLVEPGSIVGDWVVDVNGTSIGPDQFGTTSAHVRGSLGTDITGLVVPGRNVIRVKVTTDQMDGGLVNPLYLAGEFGVALDPVWLVQRSVRGSFEKYEHNLLPYYAGTVEYVTTFSLGDVSDSDEVLVSFEYDRPFHEATEVSINGSAHQPVLWQPRCIRLPTSYLRAGRNVLRTRVYTTLIRAFEGQWFDYVQHKCRAVGAPENSP